MNRLRTTLLAGLGIIAIGALAHAQQVPGAGSTINAVFNMVYDASTMKPTYSATNTVATAATATDVCALAGSATRTVKVRRIVLSGTQTTAGQVAIAVSRRSTAPTGGGISTTAAVYDTVNSLTNATNAATAVAEFWAANPTVGTLVAYLADPRMSVPAPATALGDGGPNLVVDFGVLGSPMVLRGVAQSVAVNLNGVTWTGGVLTCTFEWTEE